jgi:SAM-dependent methyltransferase
MGSRFKGFLPGNGSEPHLFQRDFWAERAIRHALAGFLERSREELRGKQILDYGAGTSPFSSLAAAIGARMLPADIGDPAPGVISIAADGRIDLPDSSVDAIVSTQVLEHVPDVQRYFAEARRVLRPGAPMFLSTHGDWVLHRIPTDFRRWTVDGLRYECELAGFELDGIETAIGILASSTHLRAMVMDGVLAKVPFLGWLRPVLSLTANLRMGLEDLITPASVMASHPQLLIVVARKARAS